VLAPHSSILIHSDLMDELRRIAAERRLVLVEGIDALDAARSGSMGSFVHLTPKGNARLAAAIEAATLETIRRRLTAREGPS